MCTIVYHTGNVIGMRRVSIRSVAFTRYNTQPLGCRAVILRGETKQVLKHKTCIHSETKLLRVQVSPNPAAILCQLYHKSHPSNTLHPSINQSKQKCLITTTESVPSSPSTNSSRLKGTGYPHAGTAASEYAITGTSVHGQDAM